MTCFAWFFAGFICGVLFVAVGAVMVLLRKLRPRIRKGAVL